MDHEEGHRIRKLARSRHAPGHWQLRARIIIASWQGQRTTAIAAALNGHPQTVRKQSPGSTCKGLRVWGTDQGLVANPG